MNDIGKLKLDETSLAILLNYILDNIKEERKIALGHHEMLSSFFDGPTGTEVMDSYAITAMLNDSSEALTRFLSTAAGSTEKAIKIAKIMSDVMSKMDTDFVSDEDREAIADLVFSEGPDNIIELESHSNA